MKAWTLLFTLAFLSVATPTIVQAQTKFAQISPLTAAGCVGETYTVALGDRLYSKYGPKWERLKETNPGLEARTSKSANGQTIVMLFPEVHDVLCIPEGMTVSEVIHQAGTVVPASVPALFPPGCSSAAGFSSIKGQACSTPTPATTPTLASTDWFQSNWLWIILALLTIAAVLFAIDWKRKRRRRLEEAARTAASEAEARAAALARERLLTQDPITSGTPFVPGGIEPTETVRLENFFDAQAETRYSQRNPGSGNTVRPARIGPIEAGTIAGEGMVGYLGGDMRPRRITTPIRAYQARYRFQDGTEEVLQCLQGCMNPVGYGGEIYRGFVFTADAIAVPVPTPPVVAVAPLPAAPAPVVEVLPAIALATDEPTVEDGVVKFEIRKATADNPAMVRMTGVDETDDNTIELRPGIIILRFIPRNGHSNGHSASGNVPDVIRQTPLDVIEQRQPGEPPTVLPRGSKHIG
jgi:hypothetical protein